MTIEKYKGYTITIEHDFDPPDPREDDNLGTMVCFHTRYDLGDRHELRAEDFSGWDDMREHLEKEHDAVVLDLRLYDHSGIAMSVTHEYPFNDRWDSMHVGFIYANRKKIAGEMGKKLDDEAIAARLASEVKVYNQYLGNDVFGYQVTDANGDEIESCWGFYGNDHEESGLLDNARSGIACHIRYLGSRRLSWQWQHAFI